MSAMRNKIIHEYFGIDLDIVWKTLGELPALETTLTNIIKKKKTKVKKEGLWYR